MRTTLACAATTAATLISCSTAPDVKRGAAAPVHASTSAASLTVVVQGVDGVGVSGIEVGTWIAEPDEPGAVESLMVQRPLESKKDPAITDASGHAVLEAGAVFFGNDDTKARSIIALSKDRSLMGSALVSRAALGNDVVITLQPACRVRIELRSSALDSLGQKLTKGFVYVFRDKVRMFGLESGRLDHEMVLCPGEYMIWMYGNDTPIAAPTYVIKPGDASLLIQQDLPASRIASLVGKPAPELDHVKAWKNSPPVRLADLRGKVVLLDFWGTWCGPCIGAMPELMATYDRYKDKGLVVIAIHDDSLPSLDEMTQKMKDAAAKFWNGRDLPFIVGLDGGGETPIPGADDSAKGATIATYGIQQFPTQVLISRDGIVIGRRGNGPKDQLPGLFGE